MIILVNKEDKSYVSNWLKIIDRVHTMTNVNITMLMVLCLPIRSFSGPKAVLTAERVTCRAKHLCHMLLRLNR
jgi:hypothetical protein